MSPIDVDANLVEWDSLINVADEGFWFYKLGQDGENLYIAVCVENQMLQHMAARNGLLFTVQSNKKNKDDIQFLFPFPDSEVKRAIKSENYESDEAYKMALINRSRGYFVHGFPKVPNGLLSLENGYRLQAAARVDNERMYYEAAVPKDLLDYTLPLATIKLSIYDGLTPLIASKKSTTVRPGGMYGYYRGRPTPRNKDKFTLAVILETKID